MKVSQAEKAFGTINFSHVKGEIEEVLEAMQSRDWENFKEEVSDVACFVQVMIHRKVGVNWTMLIGDSSAKKFLKRLEVWKDIFHREGLWFSPKYLVNGGNFKKPEKVRMAVEMARKEQG